MTLWQAALLILGGAVAVIGLLVAISFACLGVMVIIDKIRGKKSNKK